MYFNSELHGNVECSTISATAILVLLLASFQFCGIDLQPCHYGKKGCLPGKAYMLIKSS